MKISFGFQNSVTKLPTKVDLSLVYSDFTVFGSDINQCQLSLKHTRSFSKLQYSLFRDHSSRGGNSLRLKDAHPPWRPPEKRQQRQRVRHELLRGRTAGETHAGCQVVQLSMKNSYHYKVRLRNDCACLSVANS